MKKGIITLSAIVLSMNIATAQHLKEAKVPTAVKESVKKQYPTAKVTGWEMEGANYEAEFVINKVETSVLVDASGKIMETESEIAITELPKAVTDYLAKNHKDEKIKEATKIVMADGKVKYETEIKGKDLLFDESGTLIK